MTGLCPTHGPYSGADCNRCWIERTTLALDDEPETAGSVRAQLVPVDDRMSRGRGKGRRFVARPDVVGVAILDTVPAAPVELTAPRGADLCTSHGGVVVNVHADQRGVRGECSQCLNDAQRQENGLFNVGSKAR